MSSNHLTEPISGNNPIDIVLNRSSVKGVVGEDEKKDDDPLIECG